MVFNDDLIFIHIGKTGGISCSQYLLKNLRTTVYNCHENAVEATRLLNRPGVVARQDTSRHWNLAQSLDYIQKFNGKSLDDFSRVIAIIRHPVTLEYSFYQHMKKTEVQKKRGAASAQIFRYANEGFLNFVRHAGYHTPGMRQDDFVRIDGEIPPQVELIKFENLNTTLPELVAPYCRTDADRVVGHNNRTSYQASVEEELDDEILELIYHKHQYMFDSGLYSMALA
ncbi:MAG: sulfotransferase family 2 domain-containing protein [Granulosicoccus sp.]|nr:sulfotransferase family 2 domain-containing protein [Granulosicoccus sp.]